MAYNFPDSPSNGDTFTLNGVTYAYNSTKGVWKDTAVGTPPPPSVTSSDTAPSSPTSGDLWYRTDDSTLYVYYNDGSSSQWVGVSGPAGPQGTTGATGAAGADGVDATSTLAELTDTDTTTTAPSTGDLLEWNGTNWVPRAEGITQMDQWRYTSTTGVGTVDPLSTDLQRNSDASFAYIGGGMTLSSGVFTFPATGVWKVEVHASFIVDNSDSAFQLFTKASTDGGSTWVDVAEAIAGDPDTSTGTRWHSAASIAFVNVTSTTDVKVSFRTANFDSGNVLRGTADWNRTDFAFTRIGPSQ